MWMSHKVNGTNITCLDFNGGVTKINLHASLGQMKWCYLSWWLCIWDLSKCNMLELIETLLWFLNAYNTYVVGTDGGWLCMGVYITCMGQIHWNNYNFSLYELTWCKTKEVDGLHGTWGLKSIWLINWLIDWWNEFRQIVKIKICMNAWHT